MYAVNYVGTLRFAHPTSLGTSTQNKYPDSQYENTHNTRTAFGSIKITATQHIVRET
jgi:hypothetical protein